MYNLNIFHYIWLSNDNYPVAFSGIIFHHVCTPSAALVFHRLYWSQQRALDLQLFWGTCANVKRAWKVRIVGAPKVHGDASHVYVI